MQLEPAPDRRVKKVRVISRSEQNAGRWPVVNLLNEHGYKPFQFANLAMIVAALGDRVEFVQQQNAINGLGIFKHMTEVATGSTKQAAHDGGKVENEEWTFQLPC